jgi:branched-chain amino acid transport system substrate-binding protein
MRTKVMGLIAGLLSLSLLAGCSGSGSGGSGASKDPIKLGAIFDITGGTSDVGKPHAEGVKAYIDYLNSKGGINGRQLQILEVDYGYGVQKAVEAYKKFVQEDKVVAVFGWGTGDTEALKGLIAEDKIPFISGSYAETLTNPAQTPYNFIVSATYSQQARVLLDWAKEKKAGAKVAFVYNDSAFGKSPLEDAKKYAGQIGLNWVGEVVVPLNATDATTQVLELKQKGAEFVLIQETTNATAVTLKSAKAQGLLPGMQFMGLTYATNEGVVKAAGDAAEGFVGVPAFTFPSEKGKGIDEALEYAKAKKIEVSSPWLQGWAFGRIMEQGIRKAGDKVTGESIKQAWESLKDYDLGGIGAPLTFTDKDHMGAKQAKIFQVKGGQWGAITGFVTPKGK